MTSPNPIGEGAREIAGLTDEQRKAWALVGQLTDAQRAVMLGHLVEIPPDEALWLEEQGLKLPSFEERVVVTKTTWPITPLGLAVRSLLASTQVTK